MIYSFIGFRDVVVNRCVLNTFSLLDSLCGFGQGSKAKNFFGAQPRAKHVTSHQDLSSHQFAIRISDLKRCELHAFSLLDLPCGFGQVWKAKNFFAAQPRAIIRLKRLNPTRRSVAC